MLNNITNFFNLIKTGKVKTQLDGTDLLPIGTKDFRFTGQYQPTMIKYSDLVAGLVGGSNGQVLFNDNDTISGAANFYWDKVNNRISGGPTPTTSNFVIQKDITNDFIMYSPATYGGIQTIPTSGGANTVVNGKLSGTHGGYGNVAIGLGSVQADGSAFFGSIAIGQASYARGIYGLALGCEAKSGSTVTAPTAATALGYNALATRNYSVALGYNSVAAIDNAIALGDLNSLVQIGGNFTPSARVHIKGFGTTSSTTSLLVQNSLSETLRIWDDGNIGINVAGTNSGFKLDVNGTARFKDSGSNSSVIIDYATGGYIRVNDASLGEAIRLRAGGGASWFNTGQNLLIGTTTDAGFRLDVNGTARVVNDATFSRIATFNSSVVTGGTTTFLVRSNSNTQISVQENNRLNLGAAGGGITYNNVSFSLVPGSFYTFSYVPQNALDTYAFLLTANYTNVGAGGNSQGSMLRTAGSTATQVGNVTMNQIELKPTYNNTGGTTINRGIYYNPTLTSLTGTTHFAFHSTSGRVRFEGLPTSSAGLSSGDIWNDGGTLKIV